VLHCLHFTRVYEEVRRSRLTSEQRPHDILPKLFGPLRLRYAERPGGYTRVLRIEPIKEDQAPSAILELVDGPKDMRFAMTARTIAKVRANSHDINDMTAANIAKVTRYRKDAENELEGMVEQFARLEAEGDGGVEVVKKKRVYPALERSR
jgi:large subunit ribosomal protein L17